MTDPKEETQDLQARTYDHLAQEQRTLAERGLKRDEAIADIKLDTAVTKERVTHLVETTGDIKASIKEFHTATRDSIKEVQTSLKAVEGQPGQNWRDLVKVIMTVCATAIITAIALSITAK